MDLAEILTHVGIGIDAKVAPLSPASVQQFHQEQECNIPFAGLHPVTRIFLRDQL